MWVRTTGSEDALFEGFVHEIRDTLVYLKFSKKFNYVPGRKYDVEFRLNRLVFRRMHQAVECASHTARMTFPSLHLALQPVPDARVDALKPFNVDVGNNEAQRRAVASIVNMPPGSNPFIVYGP